MEVCSRRSLLSICNAFVICQCVRDSGCVMLVARLPVSNCFKINEHVFNIEFLGKIEKYPCLYNYKLLEYSQNIHGKGLEWSGQSHGLTWYWHLMLYQHYKHLWLYIWTSIWFRSHVCQKYVQKLLKTKVVSTVSMPTLVKQT